MTLKIGKRKTLYRLKDWGVSRQRYWGCPIPMIYLEDGSVVPVDKSELPVELPNDIDLNTNGNPLKSCCITGQPHFSVNTPTPWDPWPATREASIKGYLRLELKHSKFNRFNRIV